jgi:hypothetical protein
MRIDSVSSHFTSLLSENNGCGKGCENEPVPHPSVYAEGTWPLSSFLGFEEAFVGRESQNTVRQESLTDETGMTLESLQPQLFISPAVRLLWDWPSFFVRIKLEFGSGSTSIFFFLAIKEVPACFSLMLVPRR